MSTAHPDSADAASLFPVILTDPGSLPPDSGNDTRVASLRAAFANDQFARLLDPRTHDDDALAALCADALQCGVPPERVEIVIRARDLAPPGPHLAGWPWPIRVYTLGRFALTRDGESLACSGKAPRKPIELLQALIAFGGRDVHCSALIQALWPDEAARNLRKLFDNTLHRLRHLLGHDDAILMRDSKLSVSLRRCWIDAWAFDRLVRRGMEAGIEAGGDAGAALALYQGHFLQREADASWLLPYRDKLRSRYHRLICLEGERLEAAHRWENAVRLYEQALEYDCLAEGLYRRLIVCHQKRGEYAEAQRTYRRCRDMLSIVLGVAPSAETEAIRARHDGDAMR